MVKGRIYRNEKEVKSSLTITFMFCLLRPPSFYTEAQAFENFELGTFFFFFLIVNKPGPALNLVIDKEVNLYFKNML